MKNSKYQKLILRCTVELLMTASCHSVCCVLGVSVAFSTKDLSGPPSMLGSEFVLVVSTQHSSARFHHFKVQGSPQQCQISPANITCSEEVA